MAPLRIVALEGDQTGQELLEQALRVLDPEVLGLELEIGPLRPLARRTGARPRTRSASRPRRRCRETGLGLKAATITPEGADDVGSPNRILREAIDGKVIVRTGRRIPGVTPVAGVHHPIAVCRMAVGDAYGAEQWRERDGRRRARAPHRDDPAARSAGRSPSTRSARRSGSAGASTAGPKWTVSPVYEGMLKEEMDAAAERHPDVPYEPVLIDATLAGLVSGAADGAARDPVPEPRRRPALRPRPAAVRLDRRRRVGPARRSTTSCDPSAAMAEAPHGTAPALEGKDVANPMAMILAGAALLHYAGEARAPASRAVYEAVLETVAAGVRTPDLGGHASTTEFTDAVIAAVRRKLEA